MHVAEAKIHSHRNWTVFPASHKLLFLVREPVQSTSNVPTTHGLHVIGGVFEFLSVQSATVWGAGDREGGIQVSHNYQHTTEVSSTFSSSKVSIT